ncbi:MAG: hypothetical protein WBU92_05735 [Candidatus Dormiibacterota bacterium]
MDRDLPGALRKAFQAALGSVPSSGGALVSIADQDKPEGLPVAARLAELGFHLYATPGTAAALREAGVSVTEVHKLHAGRPDVVDITVGGRVQLVINTISRVATDEGGDADSGGRPVRDGFRIRQAAVQRGIPCLTSLDTAAALVCALEAAEGQPAGRAATIGEHRLGAQVAAGG